MFQICTISSFFTHFFQLKRKGPDLPAMAFLLSNRGLYVDIPGSNAKPEGPICLYGDGHGGDNQCWIWEDQKIISVLDSNLCLGVKKVCEGAEIILVPTPKKKCNLCSWMQSNNGIVLFGSNNLAMTVSKNKCILQPLSPNNPTQTWTLTPTSTHDKAQPACSTHFNYQGLTKSDCSQNWELQCSIKVKESTDCTYFCVVGWSPGGYSGIQEITKGRRVAIFSMWNDGKGNDVEILDHGPGVEVSEFGGEGEGLKSMMDFDWKEDEEITFIVKGTRESSGCLQIQRKETWRCSCFVQSRSEEHFLASFRRTSRQKPLCPGGFYSFIEDWNRSCGATGHKIRRKAEFIRPTFVGKDGSKRPLKKIRFTKVESGLDAMAKDKATAKVVGPGAFELCTGGPEDECLAKCDNNTELVGES